MAAKNDNFRVESDFLLHRANEIFPGNHGSKDDEITAMVRVFVKLLREMASSNVPRP